MISTSLLTLTYKNLTSGVASTDPNGGIRNVVKRASGHGPNITVSNGQLSNVVSVAVVGKNTITRYFT